MKDRTAPLSQAAETSSLRAEAGRHVHASLPLAPKRTLISLRGAGGSVTKPRLSLCISLVAGMALAGCAKAPPATAPLSWNQPSQSVPQWYFRPVTPPTTSWQAPSTFASPYTPSYSYNEPFSTPQESSGPSAGAVLGTLLVLGVGAALVDNMLSGDDASSSDETPTTSQKRQWFKPSDDDPEPASLTSGLFGNCHGGISYGCP